MNAVTQKILLVEDDSEIARLIKMYLESEGFQVSHIDHGNEAIAALRQLSPDLLLLDIMLPGLSGVEICKQSREFYNGPILILTASEDDITEIATLNLGADNYLSKPVKPSRLLAHINSLLRRVKSQQTEIPSMTLLFDGNLSIDMRRRKIMVSDGLVQATDAEFDLLLLLAKNAGEIVDRNQCYLQLRGIEYDGLDRSIDVRVSTLRKKIDDAGGDGDVIKSVRGKGYMLVPAK